MKTTKQNQKVLTAKANKAAHVLTVLIFIFSLTQVPLFAQDKLMMRDGSEIMSKIVEIDDYQVKYKAQDNLNGPVHLVLKSQVFMINYENGSKEVFSAEPVQVQSSINGANRGDTTIFISKPNRKFGGPRLGLTYITPGTLSDQLSDRGKTATLVQFGWQFETRLFSIENGPTGIVEFVPLVAGMEQGLFLPSASLLVGLRGSGPRAFEFAVGPNLSVTGLGMVFAVGTNFTSGNVNFPVNLAYVPSISSNNTVNGQKVIEHTGHRITLTVGFNMRKK